MTPSVLVPFEQPDWDAQLASFAGATAFHSAGWARTLHEAYGYTPCHLALRTGDRLTAVWPFMGVSSWLTGRRGLSLPFTDVCEPLGEPRLLTGLRAASQDLARAQGWKTVEWRGGRAQFPDTPASTQFHVHTLDLTRGPEALLAGLESGTRRAVRKAEQVGLTLTRSRSAEDVRTFYDLLALTRRKHGVPPQPYAFFRALHRNVIAPGQGDVFLARHQGRPIAGILCLHFGRHVLYKYGGSDEAHQQLRANNLVMWTAIRHYADAGFATFDFGRTSLDNEGLRRFKLGWGAAEHTAAYTRWDVARDRFVTAADASSGSHTRIFRALPLPVSRAIGALLYRHIP